MGWARQSEQDCFLSEPHRRVQRWAVCECVLRVLYNRKPKRKWALEGSNTGALITCTANIVLPPNGRIPGLRLGSEEVREVGLEELFGDAEKWRRVLWPWAWGHRRPRVAILVHGSPNHSTHEPCTRGASERDFAMFGPSPGTYQRQQTRFLNAALAPQKECAIVCIVTSV